MIDPRDSQWERFTAPAFIVHADVVITTPSTVALDAALAGRRVAVVGYDLELPLYHPLPILRCSDDWRAFVTADDGPMIKANAAFIRRSVIAAGAAAELLQVLVDRLASRS